MMVKTWFSENSAKVLCNFKRTFQAYINEQVNDKQCRQKTGKPFPDNILDCFKLSKDVGSCAGE